MARPVHPRSAAKTILMSSFTLVAALAHGAWLVPCPVGVDIVDPGATASLEALDLDVARVHTRDCSHAQDHVPGGLLDLAAPGTHTLSLPTGEACILGFEIAQPIHVSALIGGQSLSADISVSYIWTKTDEPVTVDPASQQATLKVELGSPDWLENLSLDGPGPWTIDSPSQPAYHEIKSALKQMTILP